MNDSRVGGQVERSTKKRGGMGRGEDGRSISQKGIQTSRAVKLMRLHPSSVYVAKTNAQQIVTYKYNNNTGRVRGNTSTASMSRIAEITVARLSRATHSTMHV